MKRKLRQYEIFKISTDRLTVQNGKKVEAKPLTLTRRVALENGEIVKIQSNQLTNQIFNYFEKNNIPCSGLNMSEILINVYVPPETKQQGERAYAVLAKNGFTVNGRRYVRLCSGSGQIRRNTVTFIREDLYEPIFNSLLCGLTLADFGRNFNAAKFNAYLGLAMSGCNLLPEALSPKVCIVDDFQSIRPHIKVNFVSEKNVKYILLPDQDYILEEDQTEYTIADGIATRKTDGATFTIHTGVKKNVTEKFYDEIEGSPALNSFDGQGIMSPEWAKQVADHLGLDYMPSAFIIRAPWVKGLLANVPFREWFSERGISEITDIFGKTRKISEIDCILSKSQFKMHKIYKEKCDSLGINAWDYHSEQMKKNHLLWGIARFNSKTDEPTKMLNYQFLQALTLKNEDVDKLCEPTERFLESISSCDIEGIYENLVINGKKCFSDIDDDNCTCENDDTSYKAFFQRIIEANPKFLGDKYVRNLILKEIRSKFQGAKIGKILTKGNFQFCISDPVAQLEWIAKNHCGAKIDVNGRVPAGYVYSNYWLNTEKHINEIVLMRSPMIDRNEVAKRKLVPVKEHYFRYLTSGLVYPIYDLTPLQQGGCDFDGDIIFSTDNPIIRKGCMESETAKPLYYTLQSTGLIGRISSINLIKADVRGLNSAVGKISNKACSLYAKLENYDRVSKEYKQIYQGIVVLGQIVGMEIDRIKTAVSPTLPIEWKTIQKIKYQCRSFEDLQGNANDESVGIDRHNDIVPDIKPYFFRYCYDYVDKAISDLNRAFEKTCIRTYGFKMDELTRRCEIGLADDNQMQFYKNYLKTFPAIDNDYIVNHICHHFEEFEKSLRKTTLADGKNMLVEYVSEDFCPDCDMAKKTEEIVAEYRRFKRISAKSSKMNLTVGRKEKSVKANNLKNLMSVFYRDKLLDMTQGDLQLAYNLLVTNYKNDEEIVWEILDDLILPIIDERGNTV